MIPEIGQFALVLALCMALLQGFAPLARRQRRRRPAQPPGEPWRCPAARGQALFVLVAYVCLTVVVHRQRLLRRLRGAELQHAVAVVLPHLRGVGRPRGIDPAVGAGAERLDAGGDAVLAQPARCCSVHGWWP